MGLRSPPFFSPSQFKDSFSFREITSSNKLLLSFSSREPERESASRVALSTATAASAAARED